MPEWLMQLLVAGGGLTIFTTGIGSLFKARREDRKAAEERRQAEKAALEARVEKLQAKVESLLMDAIAREREANTQMADRIAMDKQQNEVIGAATAALKEATAARANTKGGQ